AYSQHCARGRRCLQKIPSRGRQVHSFLQMSQSFWKVFYCSDSKSTCARLVRRRANREDRGSRIEDRGSRVEDRGSRIEDRGSRIEERRSKVEDQESMIALRYGAIPDPRSSILDLRS